jgi:hypothetical protein
MRTSEPEYEPAKVRTFIRYGLNALGVVSNILGIVGYRYDRSLSGVLFAVGIFAVLTSLIYFGPEVWGFVGRRKREIGYAFLGGAVAIGVVLPFWEPWSKVPPCPDCSVCEECAEVLYRTPTGDSYHRATCRYGKKYKDATVVTPAEAKRAHLTPCRLCNPPPL